MRFWIKTQVSCKYFLIIWTIVHAFRVFCALEVQDGAAGLDWQEAELALAEESSEVDRFNYVISRISPDGRASEEVSSCIQRARLILTNLKHLWRGRDMGLPSTDRVLLKVCCGQYKDVVQFLIIDAVKRAAVF